MPTDSIARPTRQRSAPSFVRGLLYVRHPDFLKNAVAYRENRDKIDFVLTPASIIEGKRHRRGHRKAGGECLCLRLDDFP